MLNASNAIMIWYDIPLFVPQWGNFKNYCCFSLFYLNVYHCMCVYMCVQPGTFSLAQSWIVWTGYSRFQQVLATRNPHPHPCLHLPPQPPNDWCSPCGKKTSHSSPHPRQTPQRLRMTERASDLLEKHLPKKVVLKLYSCILLLVYSNISFKLWKIHPTCNYYNNIYSKTTYLLFELF